MAQRLERRQPAAGERAFAGPEVIAKLLAQVL
jgi:hypothetical protein